jgi:hypothetical protein
VARPHGTDRARARGPGLARHGTWARRTRKTRGGGSTAAPGPQRRTPGVRTLDFSASATWACRRTRVRARARARRRRRRVPALFHLPRFENAKLPKVATKLKISKSRSCRGTTGLQLSQRATYVLLNRFVGKTCWRCRNSRPRVTVHSAFNSNLSELSLKIWMSANYEKCVPRNTEQLLYWPILNFYSEIGRTHKKTKTSFMEHLGFDLDLGFWPRSFVQICDKTCQTCLEDN